MYVENALGEGGWGQYTMLVWRDADQRVDLTTLGLEAESFTLGGHAGIPTRTHERTHAHAAKVFLRRGPRRRFRKVAFRANQTYAW